MSTYNRSEHIKSLHQEKKETTMRKVKEAIQHLLDKKEDINFVSVSLESGVSRSTLYRNAELKEEIERYKAVQPLDEVLALKEQIARLTKENMELKSNVKEK